jgi:hypothetical protein
MMLPIILAIEPDGRQAARVKALAPGHIAAEIVVVSSVAAALDVLKTRTPELVLTPPLFSTKDDAMLTARLRELEGDGVELPTLVTPLLASGDERDVEDQPSGGLLKRLKKQKTAPATSTGCSPALFAAQITEYLVRLVAERHDREQARRKDEWMHARGSASAPMLGELLTVPAHEPFAAFASFDRDDTAVWEPKAEEPVMRQSMPFEPTATEPAHLSSYGAPVDALVPMTTVPEEDSARIEHRPLRSFAFDESRPEFPPLERHSSELIAESVLLAPVAAEIPAHPWPLTPPPSFAVAEEERMELPPAETVEAVSSYETVEMSAEDLIEVVGCQDPTPRTDYPAAPTDDEVSEIEVTSEALVDDLKSFLADQELEAEFTEAEPEWVAFEPVYPSISAQLAALDPPVYKPAAFESREFVPTAPESDTLDAGMLEPDASDAPPPDELWAQIQSVQPAIAPIEGPELKKRRPPTPPRTPKAPRAKVKTAVPAKPARSPRTKKPTKPMQDEWGLYDPEQCGFAALLERLEDLTESEAADKKEEGRSAIMRR